MPQVGLAQDCRDLRFILEHTVIHYRTMARISPELENTESTHGRAVGCSASHTFPVFRMRLALEWPGFAQAEVRAEVPQPEKS